MITRVNLWDECLSVYLDRVRDYKFKWGSNDNDSHDCAIFACGAVKAITGIDYSNDFVCQYDDWKSAGRWLIKNNYCSFIDAISDRVGNPLHAAMARRGDIVGRIEPRKTLLGVCVGKFTWFIGENGLQPWPTLDCDYVWRIG